jgi:CBS domain-containing protein
MTAKDIMRPVGFTLRETDDAWTAARRLFESGQAGAIVLDAQDRLAGVISQSDLATYIRESSRSASDFYSEPDRDPLPARESSTVGRLMSRVIVQVPEDMALDEIERHMLRRRVQRVIVVAAGAALGVIAATDVIAAR